MFRWDEIYDWAGINVRDLVSSSFGSASSVLDVGAGQGKYRILLHWYPNVDGCEIHQETAIQQDLANIYRELYVGDVCDLIHTFDTGHYDVIIFGDVLEHIEVKDAQCVVDRALEIARDVVVVVPYLYPQDSHDGNDFQRHIQDDLTPELMTERYPSLRLVMLESRVGEPFKGIYRRR